MSATTTMDKVVAPTGLLARLAGFITRNKYGYLFLMPWLIGLVIWEVVPIFASLGLSFTNYDLAKADWVGLDNYIRMFTADQRYLKALTVTFRYVMIGVPLAVAHGLDAGIRAAP